MQPQESGQRRRGGASTAVITLTEELPPPAPHRVAAVDIVRGLAMVLMAIDHVRVYSGQPAAGPEAGIFFTRWVTHFCAPAFALFAGMGAYLYGRRHGDLARFLVTRGLILVVFELTVIRFFWTFSLDYSNVLAGVIWMLGWCMVLLAGLVRLWPNALAVGVIGLAIIALQQLFGFVSLGPVWEFVYPSGSKGLPNVSILYVLVPWVGVMAFGYGLGLVAALKTSDLRRRFYYKIGLALTVLFVVAGVLTTAFSQGQAPFLMRLLNQRKYPASQLYLLMTLGPALLALAWAERAKGQFVNVLATFGRVPMFYYLLHIPAIHLAALAVTYFREGGMHPERYAHAPFTQVPREFMWSLPLLYLVFAVVVVALYFPCRWFAEVKARSESMWVRML